MHDSVCGTVIYYDMEGNMDSGSFDRLLIRLRVKSPFTNGASNYFMDMFPN